MNRFLELYGILPPEISHYQIETSSINEVDKTLASRNVLLQQLKDNLNATTNKMKHVADSERHDVDYQVGDLIFLKLHTIDNKLFSKERIKYNVYKIFNIKSYIIVIHIFC